jgi:hypothetical protein
MAHAKRELVPEKPDVIVVALSVVAERQTWK